MLPFEYLSSLPLLHDLSPAVLLALLLTLLIGTTILKAFALWYAARNGQRFWFIGMLIMNTLGLLEIIYLLGFKKDTRSLEAVTKVASTPGDA